MSRAKEAVSAWTRSSPGPPTSAQLVRWWWPHHGLQRRGDQPRARRVRRRDLLDMIAAGDVDLVIGTHALIQEESISTGLGVAGRRAASLWRPSAGRPQGEGGGRRRPRPSHHDHPHPADTGDDPYGDLASPRCHAPGRAVVTTVLVGKGLADWVGAQQLIREQAAEGHQYRGVSACRGQPQGGGRRPPPSTSGCNGCSLAAGGVDPRADAVASRRNR